MDIKYIMFNLNELDKINQSEIIGLKIGKTKGLVKYVDTIPPSVLSLKSKSVEYTNVELFPLMETDEWKVKVKNSDEIVSGSVI